MPRTSPFILRQATEADFDDILTLQSLNTPDHLDASARQQGYIVSRMDHRQLDVINRQLGILVAVHDGELAGFVCLMPPDARPRPAVVDVMLEAANGQTLGQDHLSELRTFLYGPVCIAAAFRGRGLLKLLYNAVKTHLRGAYDAGLAFIAEDNPRSLAAHVQGLGMHDIVRFRCADKMYHLVAFRI